MKKILVVAAHPDDEVLGCGATIYKYIQRGAKVHLIILAEGITSRMHTDELSLCKEELTELHKNMYAVAKFLGIEKIIECGFPDNRMDSLVQLDIVKKIESEIEDFNPDMVFTHHAGDVNIDHRIAHEAVVTAVRSLPGQSVKALLFFEILSSTEWQIQTENKVFLPNWYVDIADVLEKKIEALNFYKTEMRDYPHSRSYEAVRALALYRGVSAGVKFAEAFSLGKFIQ